MTTTAQLLIDARARLGECALWCDRSASLYWTDIEAATLSRWRSRDGSVRDWSLPERVGSFALCEQPSQLLLGLASGIALFNLQSGALTPIVAVEPEQPNTRINDGRCDREGRFVFGMFRHTRDAEPVGGFYRVTADLAVERLPLPPAAVGNSIAFSPDGSRLYFTDTPTRVIQCAEYHADGRIGAPRPFVRLPASAGYPDGSTVDAEGGLWNAQWDGGCVVRYDERGVQTARIALPVSRPTCAAFGGAALDRLFVTTARVGLDAERLQREPDAGGVFVVAQPGWRGLPEPRFATSLRV